MSKVRVIVEFEQDGDITFKKHQLDILLNESISGDGIINVKTLGAYMDEAGNAITSDLYVDDSNFEEVVAQLLVENGKQQDEIDDFLNDGEQVIKLHDAWMDYVMNNTKSNKDGKEYLRYLAEDFFQKIN